MTFRQILWVCQLRKPVNVRCILRHRTSFSSSGFDKRVKIVLPEDARKAATFQVFSDNST